MSANPYETDRLLNEYLLFHYGSADEVLPWPDGPRNALDYAVRCVSECLDAGSVPDGARALDVGCAVGRSTFELARHCLEVIGIDYSQRFVGAARVLSKGGEHPFHRADEGDLTTPLLARVPDGVERQRVRFEHGDAHELRDDLGCFDVVLAANLIDRLAEPRRFLAQLPALVKPGGQLILSSPYTWLRDYTQVGEWIGGFTDESGPQRTLGALAAVLSPHFEMKAAKDLPFLIREHARKYQWSVAQATVWRRRPC